MSSSSSSRNRAPILDYDGNVGGEKNTKSIKNKIEIYSRVICTYYMPRLLLLLYISTTVVVDDGGVNVKYEMCWLVSG